MVDAKGTLKLPPALNGRQITYLKAVCNATRSRGEWIEYGPVGARHLDPAPGAPSLRRTLDAHDLVDNGTGATWKALAGRGLLERKWMATGLVDKTTGNTIDSLFVRLTAAGRKEGGEHFTPLAKPAVRQESPLSLSALRLIAYGQAHPDDSFDFHAPWGICPVEYMAILSNCRGLVKRGLLSGVAPDDMRITEAGRAMDVTQQPGWKPLRPRPAVE